MNDYRRDEELKAQRIESCERHQWKESVCLLDNRRATSVSRNSEAESSESGAAVSRRPQVGRERAHVRERISAGGVRGGFHAVRFAATGPLEGILAQRKAGAQFPLIAQRR